MESQQYQEQMQQPMGFGSPINSMGSTVLVLTDADETVRGFRLMLEGKGISTNGEEVELAEPLMNKVGIASMTGMFKEFLNKTTSMSNLHDINEVDRLRNHQMDRVVETLMMKRTAFGIQDDTIRSNIVGNMVSQSHVGLKQPMDNGIKVFLGKTTQEITQKVNQSNKNSDAGLFSFLNQKNNN
jgi:hypothetical protein